MNDPLDLDAEDEQTAQLLADDRPRPSPALRRRVRHRIGLAFVRQAMHRRAVALATSGALLLAVALVLALTAPD